MDLLSHLEVNITHDKDSYKATCDVFPKCTGIGETEEAALEKLSLSIARFIGNLAKNTFKTILSSSRYTELILDTSENTKSQRRVFQIDPNIANMTKSLFVKVKTSNTTLPKEKVDIQTFVNKMDHHSITQMMDSSDTMEKQLQADPDQEGFVFGFPLSFN